MVPASVRMGALAVALGLACAGCSGGDTPNATPSVHDSVMSDSTLVPEVTAGPGSTASPSVEPPAVSAPIETMRVVARTDVVAGLSAPWALAFDGTAMLVTERDSARVLRVDGGEVTVLGGPGAQALAAEVDSTAEAGLLGLALLPVDPSVVYVYLTRGDGNAVVRMTLTGDELSAPEDVVTGIPKARNHDGGRIAFGPDGYLYVATGDAAVPDLAQDRSTLHGTVLRVDADGEPAPGNPFGDAVWTYGHRNVQGLGWSTDGRLFASEFGQSDADELNVLVPGANYGWPTVEGLIGSPAGTSLGDTVDGLTYPVAEWRPTSAASPSGITVTDEAVYVAALRGETLYRVPFTADGIGEPQALVTDLGRLRAVELGPDGHLYVLTNNTDGRGDPHPGDDRIVRIELEPA